MSSPIKLREIENHYYSIPLPKPDSNSNASMDSSSQKSYGSKAISVIDLHPDGSRFYCFPRFLYDSSSIFSVQETLASTTRTSSPQATLVDPMASTHIRESLLKPTVEALNGGPLKAKPCPPKVNLVHAKATFVNKNY